MPADSKCFDALWSCSDGRSVTQPIGNDRRSVLNVTCNRTVTLDAGSLSLTLQSRKRDFKYTDLNYFLLSGVFAVADADYYITCYSGSAGDSDCSFSDTYTTVDIELQYLDLRYDVVVTREVTDVMTATDEYRKPTPGKTVSVFMGYDSTNFFPVMFDTIPIAEQVRYYLYIGGVKTELHSEDIHRGSDNAYLLMESFPKSPYGIRFNDAWAQDVEWYRSDENTLDDGDRFLFWPPWARQCGQLNQALDKFNRDLVNQYEQDQSDVTGTSGQNPGITQSMAFNGSVAFDADHNMFYSIGVPGYAYATDPAYVLNQRLVINGVDADIPTDSETDAWWPIAPL